MVNTERKDWTGIVLAAGLSSRAGVFKQLFGVRGKALVEHAVDSLAAHCSRVVVVTGHRRKEVEARLAGRPEVQCVFNPEYEGDMFLSVQAGVAAVGPASPGTFLLPVDCPFVKPATLDALVAAFEAAGGERPCVPEYQGRGGHPVLLSPGTREAVLAARVPGTLRGVVAEQGALRVNVEDAMVVADGDTEIEVTIVKEFLDESCE